MHAFKHVGITVKSDLPEKGLLLDRVVSILRGHKIQACVDAPRMKGVDCVKGLKEMSKEPIDLLIVIGGDGTIFRAVRELETRRVPILGINRGAIGFLAELDLDEVEAALPRMLKGEGMFEERHLLSVTVTRATKKVFEGRALNEVVIAQGAIARLLHLRTTVRGEELTTYRADGLIVATPTGSTAYSLSAGGPIVHPRHHAVILTPINPHSFTQKPIVLPGADVVDVEVIQRVNKFIDSEVSLTLDGQVYHRLKPHDHVRVETDPHAVTFFRRKQDTFFHTLRTKLRWGEVIES